MKNSEQCLNIRVGWINGGYYYINLWLCKLGWETSHFWCTLIATVIILQPSFSFLKYLPIFEQKQHIETEIYIILIIYWKEMSRRMTILRQLCSPEFLEIKSKVMISGELCSSAGSEWRISCLDFAWGTRLPCLMAPTLHHSCLLHPSFHHPPMNQTLK